VASPVTGRRTVVITGIGDGLGRETALKLAARHYRVHGITLSRRAATELNGARGGAITATVGDITDEGAVRSWVAKVSEALGQDGLDVLISNAGSLTPGPLEVLPPDVVRHDIEVNVLGALRVINGLLPALRTARGRIVHLSVFAPRFPFPAGEGEGAPDPVTEAFGHVHRGGLDSFAGDFVLVRTGSARGGGPAKARARLQWIVESMTAEQRRLYGDAVTEFTAGLGSPHGGERMAGESAGRLIDIVERVPAPVHAFLDDDAESVLRLPAKRLGTSRDEPRLESAPRA
jgi:NAD(P)-dependent dehydrogenase (short-subunit alcohol dehydrogenase family)